MSNIMPSLVIVKTGDAYPEVVAQHGDFEQLFIQQIASAMPEHLALEVWDARAACSPPTSSVAGILITGSHSMVSDQEPWSEALKPWLRQALTDNIPMLGICYGHQLMAAAFGGVSDYHPAGRESGTHSVSLTPLGQQDPLLGQLPERFPAHLTHAQSVIQRPSCAEVLAFNPHDPHQALRYGSKQWSVQFHPEFTLPVMQAYLERQRETLEGQGESLNQLLTSTQATPEASSLLRRFLGFL